MKIALFELNDDEIPRVGVVDEEHGVIKCPKREIEVSEFEGLASLIDEEIGELDEELSLDEVELLAPIPMPTRNIFCVGKNYYDHAKEFSQSGFDSSAAQGEVPAAPIVFPKFLRVSSDTVIQLLLTPGFLPQSITKLSLE